MRRLWIIAALLAFGYTLVPAIPAAAGDDLHTAGLELTVRSQATHVAVGTEVACLAIVD